VVKPPSQELPWTVEKQGDDYVIIDANGFYVANFSNVSIEPVFVCAIANEWHRKQQRKRRRK
jgi:hypothetical protein